jgi:protein O-mannosyl-transferase
MFNGLTDLLEHKKLSAPIIITGFIFLTFIWSLPNSFVLDDPSQIFNVQVENFNLRQIFTGSTFGVSGTDRPEGAYYKPLMATTYAFIYNVFGAHPAPFHFFQITIASLNAILVFFLLKRFFAPTIALFLALIFGLHPFNSEAVLYISNFQDVLFFFFGMLGFLIATKENLSKKGVFLSSVLLLMSLLAKETGILFFAVTVFYKLLFSKKKESFYSLIVVLGAALLVYLPMRLSAVGIPHLKETPYPIMRLSLTERLLNIPAMLFYYIRNFFMPYDFAVAQHWVISSVSINEFYLPLFFDLIFLSTIVFPLIILIKRKSKFTRLYLFFTVWFLLGMLIHLNVFPLDVTVADRWFYFPSVGLIALIGIALNYSKLNGKKIVLILLLVLALVFSARTMVRVFDWRNGISLNQRDLKYSRNSFPLENNYAFELINDGRYDEALVHAKKSVELGPWWWLNWNNLGIIYRHKGYNENPKYYAFAKKAFKQAAKNTNTFYMPYENLAELLYNYGAPEESQEFIIDTSKKMDLSGRLWFYLSLTQLKLGDKSGALQAAEQAKTFSPADTQIQLLYNALHNNLDIQLQKPQY